MIGALALGAILGFAFAMALDVYEAWRKAEREVAEARERVAKEER